MYIPTTFTFPDNKSKGHTKRDDFSKDNIWIIVLSFAILLVIFAGILYRWRMRSKQQAQEYSASWPS
ncbi:hypothetical protein PMZ80_008050 [Knufia obscura]|uniref:Uncharacterized protein n=2 Tax=Knufia TaxID=430999 RepID=A0AAN8F5R0_9EURO|nr:hypothetical protein PMZ80_008050 [Knufia obscura]KAK5957223.1 hypothetical protein OHC33_001594 [Knufia fluminis]